jgi:hypothetical protein
MSSYRMNFPAGFPEQNKAMSRTSVLARMVMEDLPIIQGVPFEVSINAAAGLLNVGYG